MRREPNESNIQYCSEYLRTLFSPSGAAALIRKFWRARERTKQPSREDLIAAHEKKKERKAKAKAQSSKAARKSSASTTPKPRKPSVVSSEDLDEKSSKKKSSTSAKKPTSSAAPTKGSKRQRSLSLSDDEMDVDRTTADDDTTPPPPKKRKSELATALNGRNASKTGKAAKERISEIQEVGDDEVVGSIDHEAVAEQTWVKYGKLKSWEKIIQKVDTVESDPNDPDNLTGKGFWVLFREYVLYLTSSGG